MRCDDARSAIKEGETIAKPLAESQGLPVDARPDDRGRRRDRRAGHHAQQGRRLLRRGGLDAIDGLTSLIEPLMMASLGVVVGGMVIALYLPMFQVITLVK